MYSERLFGLFLIFTLESLKFERKYEDIMFGAAFVVQSLHKLVVLQVNLQKKMQIIEPTLQLDLFIPSHSGKNKTKQ